ncbi:L-amino acid amidase [Lachnellula suecica]|uniref:L-amino acid amidase n=1 Tax=Lachnellula suecica TaxID=602035 RepID=A0A8T9CG72_9HELO|nr:L-amino acid amidase [Lachnellula suecica]
MAQVPTREGTIPFKIPKYDVPCATYYKIFGDLASAISPLVVVHGGPGAGHKYLLSFAGLWPRYGIPVVFYDQIGCASSTHLPQTAGDGDFWKESLFLDELDNLIDHLGLRGGFHLLGQSWGGMLVGSYAAKRPRGLQRLVIASGLASWELSMKGIETRRCELPEETLQTLRKYEQDGDYDNPEYKEATAMFSKKFVFRDDQSPPQMLMAGLQNLAADKTVYGTMIGPSIHVPIGSLLGWTSIPGLSQIIAPTLLYNGEYDTSHDIAQIPYFEHIPKVRWVTFANGGHFCHLEQGLRERVFTTVGDFLSQGNESH